MLRSDFFQSHEVIGSSLLFVHDSTQASIWLIDFAKTVSLPSGANITHMNEWIVGNHEDGYLIGINNLIQIFEELISSEDETMPMERQLNEADYDIPESNRTIGESSSVTISENQIQENNVDLQQEIDAMKIDQSMQGQAEDNRNQDDARK